MVFFVKQIPDMLLYIVYFSVLVRLSFRLVVFAVAEAIIFGHLFVSNSVEHRVRSKIFYEQIKSI